MQVFEMTDPSKKVYDSIHEALLDYARLGKKTYDEMQLQKPQGHLTNWHKSNPQMPFEVL